MSDLIRPQPTDWIVTIWLKDGGTYSRRISPGIMDEAGAVHIALLASSIHVSNLERWSARRADSPQKLTVDGEDFLEEIRRRRSTWQ